MEQLDSHNDSASRSVLVALAATDSADKNIVRPLRKGKICAARLEGSVVILDIVLDDFIVENLAGAAWSELSALTLGAPSKFGPEAQRGFYLQELRDVPQAVLGAKSILAWEKVATAFFEVALADAKDANMAARRIPFLYYLALPKKKRGWRFNSSQGLDIEAGSSFYIDVHTLACPHYSTFHNAIGEVYLDLSHPGAVFASSRRARIDSRRDVRRIRITGAPLFREAQGHLSVRTVVFENTETTPSDAKSERSPMAASKRQEAVISRYDIPLKVGIFRPLIASFLMAVAGAVAVFKSPAANTVISGRDFFLPVLVGVLAFVALISGLRKDGK